MLNLGLYNIIVGIIGARLYYILVFNPTYYLNHPRDIVMIHQGGLSIQGALIAVILFSLIYVKQQGLFFWKVADTFAPAVILGQAVGRIGCDVFGIPMNKSFFWGVEINNQLFHPVQIYESLLNYILFMLLWSYRDRVKYDGQLFLYYLIGFSVNRGLVEVFRVNPIVLASFTVAHFTSLIIICGALIAMWHLNKQSNNNMKLTSISKKRKLVDNGLVVGAMILSAAVYYAIY
jgi:phosphatidylglycerol:prolipoprotein diacylglycerol transferase